MALSWVHESPARWDADKQRIIGGAPKGAFAPAVREPGEPVAGEWWRVEDGGHAVGYGWIDATWEGAEILLCVDPTRQRQGVGTFVIDSLEREATARGLSYLFNTVRPTHPEREWVTHWLEGRGFTATTDGELRRRVGAH